VRWLSDGRNVYLVDELLHDKRCVVRCVIVMQKPLPLPLFPPLSPNCIPQPLQNVHIEITSNALPRRYEPTVHEIVDVKEFQELLIAPRIVK
jgi:hypothetical protein